MFKNYNIHRSVYDFNSSLFSVFYVKNGLIVFMLGSRKKIMILSLVVNYVPKINLLFLKLIILNIYKYSKVKLNI